MRPSLIALVAAFVVGLGACTPPPPNAPTANPLNKPQADDPAGARLMVEHPAQAPSQPAAASAPPLPNSPKPSDTAPPDTLTQTRPNAQTPSAAAPPNVPNAMPQPDPL